MGAQEDYERFNGIAEELGLEDKDREGFVNSAMKRKGYKPQTTWGDPDPKEGEEGESDFFSNRREQREKREVGGDGKKASGGGWQYS